MSTGRRTRTADDGPGLPAAAPHPYLVRSLSYDRPTQPSARWSLSELSEITVSGAGPASAVRTGRSLAIATDDAWASTRHATIRSSFGRWVIEDLGSKNGTSVNSERITRHALDDGDLIEIGRTAWWFRDLVSAKPASDVEHVDRARSFVTLHAPLETALVRASDGVSARLPILVTGESGAGKERFVGALHASTDRPGALVAVNCAALPAALVEGELFGHRRGAFSGAVAERAGYVRAADRGTLFLDEIGDMPPAAQAALLRVIAERTVTPVGDEEAVSVDLSVVAATHRDLDALASAGTFRSDLLARIRGIVIAIPPLRERREDIGIFIARGLERVAPSATLSPEAGRRLLRAPWRLNVRELDSAVASAALRANGRPIAADDLVGVPTLETSPPEAVLSADDVALRDRLVAALARHRGNISAVARELGRDRKQIHRWIARFAIDVPH